VRRLPIERRKKMNGIPIEQLLCMKYSCVIQGTVEVREPCFVEAAGYAVIYKGEEPYSVPLCEEHFVGFDRTDWQM
jgi:hypothetical protein